MPNMNEQQKQPFEPHEPETETGTKPGEPEVKQTIQVQPEKVPTEEQPLAGQQPHRPRRPGTGARGTAAMDPQTRKEVARKGGLAVSRNRQHMAEIGRKGGQTVSKNREHMAQIGRKGGAASRGHR